MIDLSAMKGIRVNPSRKTVRAETGLTLGEFDRETQAFGLATTLGVVSKTGIAGLTLGGGWGHLHAKYGLALDNVTGADVVTADGRLLTANASQNEDLFWGVRGGSGNFGIVTSLQYRLHELVLCSVAPYSTRLQKPRKFSTSFAITPRPFQTNWSSNAAHFHCLTAYRFLPSRLVTVDGLPKVKRS
jgi:FAD/FMN-containing dehydrogenase